MLLVFDSCDDDGRPRDHDVVESTATLYSRISQHIERGLAYAIKMGGQIDDSIRLKYPAVLDSIYAAKTYQSVWSREGRHSAQADSLIHFIRNSIRYGLFSEDYHGRQLEYVYSDILSDTSGAVQRRDAAMWMRFDLMLTDAFIHLCRDLDVGRLSLDSTFMRPDSFFKAADYAVSLESLLAGESLTAILEAYEPVHPDYHALKQKIMPFRDSAGLDLAFTYVDYPYSDSLEFITQLSKRLKEEGVIPWQTVQVDTALLASAIRRVQKERGLTIDGKYGPQFIGSLNNTATEQFIRIAINLDRYKKLPKQMPERYIWVNLPGYYLSVRDADSLLMESRIVVGKPKTRTPLLHSRIGNIVTYPQWTIPNSIIIKEILPALKRDPGYLAKKGYTLSTWKGEEVDPYTVNWSVYSKGIPYKIVQGSGDDNALGVLKFNFANKFDVYLHDTNQRYYFSRSERALSHGCVRVQEWEKLSHYVVGLDTALPEREKPAAVLDSMRNWLENKEKRVIHLKYRLPLFLRYVTAEVRKDKLIFYDDIYGEDRIARKQIIANR